MDAENEALMSVIMLLAIELIQTYNSGLSKKAIKSRMQRIAGDLLYACESDVNAYKVAQESESGGSEVKN